MKRINFQKEQKICADHETFPLTVVGFDSLTYRINFRTAYIDGCVSSFGNR